MALPQGTFPPVRHWFCFRVLPALGTQNMFFSEISILHFFHSVQCHVLGISMCANNLLQIVCPAIFMHSASGRWKDGYWEWENLPTTHPHWKEMCLTDPIFWGIKKTVFFCQPSRPLSSALPIFNSLFSSSNQLCLTLLCVLSSYQIYPFCFSSSHHPCFNLCGPKISVSISFKINTRS